MPKPHEIDINLVGEKWRVTLMPNGKELGSFKTHEEAILFKIDVIKGRANLAKKGK